MRGITVLAVSALVLVACSSLQAATSSTTSLRISFWEEGSGAPDSVWTLRCSPAGGSLERPARACKKLAAGGAKLFASFPPDTACTEIYGGPQHARIVGTVAGKRVWTTLTRTNGCEISRWARVSPWLLPPGGVT